MATPPRHTHTPPGHGRRWVGEAGSRTGNRKSCEREREEAVGVRGGGSHDVPQLPQSLGENEKMGSLGGFTRQAQCPNYLPVNKGGSFATSWAHRCSPPPANTHIPTATVTVTAAQRELPLSLFCHQIRSVQTRRSPRYDSTWCQL